MAGHSGDCSIAVIGTVNGVNFTDGLDGLASSVTVLGGNLLYGCRDRNKERDRADYLCGGGSAPWISAVFNVYPASVFMGDTGSLALGRICSIRQHTCSRCRLFIIIVGLIYLVEVLSVMIQVTYFKKTGGKANL